MAVDSRLWFGRERVHRHTVIMACTASVMKGDVKKCLAAGMDDFISKPVKIEEIGRIIGKWLT